MSLEEGSQFLLYRGKYSPDTRFDTETSLSWEQEKIADWRVAKQIVKTLRGLPLALDQAGAYIRETQCGFNDCDESRSGTGGNGCADRLALVGRSVLHFWLQA